MDEAELYRRMVELAHQVSAIEDKVDFIMHELKLDYHQPAMPEPDEIYKLVQAGQKLQAIKLYTEKHKVNLAQAKAAVEQMELAK